MLFKIRKAIRSDKFENAYLFLVYYLCFMALLEFL